MKEINCILCRSKNISLLETVDTRQLIKLYRKRAGVNTQRFFRNENIDLIRCNDCDLRFYWPQTITDGKFYDELQHYKNYYLQIKAEYTEASKYVAADDILLEVGCGEGLFKSFINCGSYTGLEFSDTAIKKASEMGLNVLKQNIEEHAELNKEKYDVICCFQVLEHIENPERFLSTATALLKPGGKLIIAVPNEDSFINKATNFYLNMPPHHSTRWTNEALKNIGAFFNLHLVSFFYEPLQSFHKSFFLKTKIYTRLSSFFGKSYKSIDTEITGTVLYGTATILAYIISPFFAKFQNVRGQSVMVVYKK